MEIECRGCNTVCVAKEGFVLQYVKQIKNIGVTR
jgi:hypothetical protein